MFQNDTKLKLLPGASDPSSVGLAVGSSYIIGSAGLPIEGVSDNATLTAGGYVTAASQEARRKELTANTALVSLPPGESPTLYRYAATYVVGAGMGAINVDPGKAQYCSAGSFTFTYDSDQ